MEDLLTGDVRPIRRAPPPPRAKPNIQQPRNDDLLVIQSGEVSRTETNFKARKPTSNGISRSTSMPLSNKPQKKMPPPRPPPPKKSHHPQEQNGTSSRGVVGGLFGRVRGPPPSRPKPSSAHNSVSAPSTPVTEASLIDFSSPPGSPTTRSGSDGLSVNSFGSESSSGNQSSGFDDSFDPFGSILDQNVFTAPKKVGVSSFYTGQYAGDPAPQAQTVHTNNQDPFEMLARRTASAATSQSQETPSANSQPKPNPMVLPHSSSQPSTQNATINKPEQKANFRPTIIRTKAPVTSSHVESAGGTGNNNKNQYGGLIEDISSIDWGVSRTGGINIIDQTIPEEPPPLPPRPEAEEEDEDRPYGMAEFDFETSQPDDLSFKNGDLIQLLYRVNDDWLFGRCGHKEGMFPQSFIKIVVPLAGEEVTAPNQSSIPEMSSNKSSESLDLVTALYTFEAEASEDLTILEGCTVRVLGRLSEEWLYGEYEGKCGQFPANFVDRVPENLQQM